MEFIGQEELIANLRSTNARAILIQGPSHFGKKTLIRGLFKEEGLYVYEVSGSIGDFRETIDFIKSQTNPMMYLIPDVDRLHPGVQNLLLKILEEPPMKARFCLTASNTILPTIRSRCICYSMQPYTPEQIRSGLSSAEMPLFMNAAPEIRQAVASPGQVHSLYGWGKPEAVLSLIEQMTSIKSNLNAPLAYVLKLANDLMKYMKENNVDMYTFFLLARGMYSEYISYQILTQNLNELDRYYVCYFYAELWKEVACS